MLFAGILESEGPKIFTLGNAFFNLDTPQYGRYDDELLKCLLILNYYPSGILLPERYRPDLQQLRFYYYLRTSAKNSYL